MVYADAGDLAISALDTVDSGLVGRLIERASSKIDGELAAAGLIADVLSAELLKECCCEMVESVLESAVGSDYGDTITYEVASRRMQVPPEYKRMLGISRQRIGGLRL